MGGAPPRQSPERSGAAGGPPDRAVRRHDVQRHLFQTLYPVAEPKVDFQKLMAPGGLAPERINGRAAMLAFVAAAGAELGGAGSVYDQLGHGGFGAMVKVILVVAAASFVPIARGKSGKATFLKGSDPLRVGRFNADVELLNGRAAMVGFAFLLVAEAFTHQAFL